MMKTSIKSMPIILVFIQLSGCNNETETFSSVNDTLIAKVITTILEIENLDYSNSKVYPKFLKYNPDIEYPIICWEKDSFEVRSNSNEVPTAPPEPKVKNPLSLRNNLAVNYLIYLFETQCELNLTVEDTINFRKQMEYSMQDLNISFLNDSILIINDTIDIHSILSKGHQEIYFFSLPIFTNDKKEVFVRMFHIERIGGHGDWMILKLQNGYWEICKTGGYFNKD